MFWWKAVPSPMYDPRAELAAALSFYKFTNFRANSCYVNAEYS